MLRFIYWPSWLAWEITVHFFTTLDKFVSRIAFALKAHCQKLNTLTKSRTDVSVKLPLGGGVYWKWEICEEQCGFKKDRNCSVQIFVVRQLCESLKEGKKMALLAFMDFEKAYDRVDTEGMCQVLEFSWSRRKGFGRHKEFLWTD